MKNVDLTQIHYLSGPFHIETAEPGDVLLVEIQDVQPFQEQPWGFTGVFDKQNGGGFLDELYPKAYVPIPFNVPSSDPFIVPRRSGILRAYFVHRAISLTSALQA